ncbi:Protein FAM92A isoform 2 [Schistosoma japonicum]|uniref:Protein FAM92A isoform 2 n=1 Tax=Schistosoma japonicum TaxID=6182 RepID=A0A4Z2DEB0_SCHJA|nr:Protein FAM92A isoform 2 [Schistosoma japonicum]
MSSTIGPNSRFHRVSEIKECENQSKFVNQRVNEIETFFGNLCAELVSYTRRTSKLRNNGDEIARILLDYSNKEKINRTTSDALRKVSEYFATVEDYRHTEIDRIVGKVINPLSAYGEEIKHIKTNLKVESAARKREITNMRKLERSKTIQSSREQQPKAEIQLHNAMIDATKSANNLERCVLDFEGRRLKGLKRIITDFIQIEMLWHAKALETYSLAYNAIQLLHEEADLIEFRGTLLRSGSNLTVLNNNLPISQQSISIGGHSSPMISPSIPIRDHRSYRPSSSQHSPMNSMKTTGSRCSLTSLNRNKKNKQLQVQQIQHRQQQQDQFPYSQQLQQQQRQQNDDVTSLFTEGDDDDVGVHHNDRDKLEDRNLMNGLQDLEDDDDEFNGEGNSEDEEDDEDIDEEDNDDYAVHSTTNHSPPRNLNHPALSSTTNRTSGSTQQSPLKSALKTGISKL